MAGVSRYARQTGKTFGSLARFSPQYRTVGCGSNVKAALERTQASAKNHPALAASAIHARLQTTSAGEEARRSTAR